MHKFSFILNDPVLAGFNESVWADIEKVRFITVHLFWVQFVQSVAKQSCPNQKENRKEAVYTSHLELSQ